MLFVETEIKIQQLPSNTIKGSKFVGTIYDDEHQIISMHSTSDLDSLMESVVRFLKAEVYADV